MRAVCVGAGRWARGEVSDQKQCQLGACKAQRRQSGSRATAAPAQGAITTNHNLVTAQQQHSLGKRTGQHGNCSTIAMRSGMCMHSLRIIAAAAAVLWSPLWSQNHSIPHNTNQHTNCLPASPDTRACICTLSFSSCALSLSSCIVRWWAARSSSCCRCSKCMAALLSSPSAAPSAGKQGDVNR